MFQWFLVPIVSTSMLHLPAGGCFTWPPFNPRQFRQVYSFSGPCRLRGSHLPYNFLLGEAPWEEGVASLVNLGQGMRHPSPVPFSSFHILGARLPTQWIQTHILRGRPHIGEANPGHRQPLQMLGSQLLHSSA